MFGLGGLGKLLIIGGAFLILLGLLFTFWGRVPFFGKLPGDIVVQTGSFRLFFPLATCIISLILTILVNIVFKLFR